MASTYTEATLLVDAAEEALVVGGDDPSENSPATAATHALDPKDPCTFCAHEDFVIFSEFSEVLGPLPLLTVPPHVHDEPAAELDMNAFILKIMSVDYQANPSGQFNLAEDAQVLQTPVVPGVHAYVHYFTLYDLHARGFVRPMCLAFVTRDKKKLEGQFLQLREAFLKVTELIKLDNRQIFLEDIKHALHCLRSTQEQYFRLKKMEDEREILSTESKQLLQSIDIEQLVNHYSELKNLLHTVEPSLNKEQQMMELKDWCAAIKNSDLLEAKRLLQKLECHSAKVPCNLSGSKRARFIRPVVCISPWGCAAGLWHLIDLHHFFARCSLGVDLDLVATTFNQAIRPRQLTFRGINLALDDANFLKLLSNITDPKECTIDQNSLILDNHKELSSSDSNCSFHSAKPSLLSSSGSDSFRDLDRNLSDWSLNDNAAEKFQTDCLWSEFPANTKSGLGLLDFFTKYSAAARHVIYSLLTGRTVVLAAAKHEKAYAVEITQALAPFVPRRNTKSVLSNFIIF
ncbi:uncharacterized protein LOC132198145 isoform X2 [Neocloeon triangulifer]|uniref:uncharacterized protein LOC132198145 isoform X2 n=1 Tax=Neocloeon triangulifer TaxID=2078957 RepID=UPI00286F2A2A|nr:uncharacterized protein LOC132198145 isoform X2 [Neocloeon triangulifer]